MDNRYFLIAFLFVLIPAALFAQDDNYKLEFAPDLWYNSVDGIRVGARVLGDVEGTFQDGPHRLDAGMWLGTNFPDQPVSYFVSFTEPIPSLSEFGEEFNIQLISSIRTGYNRHGFAINKRFQKGFDELRYQEIRVSLFQEKATDNDYRLNAFQVKDWKTLAGVAFRTSGFTALGAFKTHLSFQQNVNKASGNFSIGSAEVKHLTELGKGFGLNLRAFGVLVSSDAPLEYNYSMANRAPIAWLNNGVTRARGTIPDVFFENGLVQVAGGFNLRGYNTTSFTTQSGNTDYTISYTGTLDKGFSVNTELIFPNFLNSLLNRSMVGDFVHLKSYLFQDVGRVSGIRIEDDLSLDFEETVANAGIGIQFSINIPDWLGKDRGFALRYEVPFWLSDPESGEESFKFRNLIGIGAVISL
ncbi:hypothetical protein [Gracilimonas sp. BCB1]|uniref:hypothetical protein n=1 Tax=Gracilimonas sp. BCB1 TaxID=3152362 RepID=UPI0032D948E9